MSLFRRGGNSQLTLDSMGPLPLSIFGTEEAGTAFSLSRASSMAGGFGVNLDRGTSSLFFIGDFPGNFIGEISFLDFLVLLFIGVTGGSAFSGTRWARFWVLLGELPLLNLVNGP